MKKRILYLDILRVLACILVLLTHSAMPTNDISQNKFYAFFSTLGAPSSELFLTISGATLLPIKKGFKDFYQKRFTKLLIPFFIWSTIYLIFYYLTGDKSFSVTIINFILLPLKPVHGVFWFIYAICGLYLLAPFISKWIIQSSEKQIILFLSLWIITLCLPFLNYLIPNFYELNGSYYNMFNSFGGFIGYMVLGYFLKQYFTYNVPVIINYLITFILFTIVYLFKNNNWNTSILLDNLSLFSAIAVTNIIIYIKKISNSTFFINRSHQIAQISKYTFGIYLIHILVIREFIWHFWSSSHRLAAYIEIPLICMLGFIISIIILKILSYLPFSKYIIGF